MKPLKVLFTSDNHLGLRIDNIDQTQDILEYLIRFVNHAIELKQAGHRVIIVFGGDMFDSNDPSETQIGAFIVVMGMIKQHEIETYVLVGNHEAKANPERLSCLSFIKEASVGYPTIKLVEDITYMDMGESINGRLHFTFLPHVSKALIEKKKLNCTPQEYIDNKCERILKKLENKIGDHIVFSHLNIKGAHGGSEEDLLKRSDVYLPVCLQGFTLGIRPIVVQAHIHTRQQLDNVHIVGSPVFCSYNESGEKGYLVFTIGHSIGDEWSMDYHPAKTPEFVSMELDMINQTAPFFKIEAVRSMLKEIPKDQKVIIKIDITINPENNTYDWSSIQDKIQNHFPLALVKTVVPRIVSKRLVRNPNQKIGMTPDEAIRSFIKMNWASDKERAKKIYKKAKTYTGVQ